MAISMVSLFKQQQKRSKIIKITSKRVRHFSELLMIFIDVIFERILLPYGYLSFVLALWVCVCARTHQRIF